MRGEVIAAGTAHTPARPDNDEPAMAAPGLTMAIRNGLASLADDGLRAGWVLTDLTFEVFRHLELSAAMTRSQRFLCEPQQVEAPAQRMGYLGAAAMPLHLTIMCEGWRRGFAPHALAVSLAGSDSGERAVMLVASPASGG
jgi:3-oxoacyl-[acyl-carrier-protein] synthase-1